jgi:glyceraldehyde-3-phosphate dehydrogenase (ferredoxin)
MPRNYRALHISATDGSHEFRTFEDPAIIGVIDYAWRLGDAGRIHTVVGSGPIAGSFVPGSNRLVVCGESPLWGCFFPSTMGGAGLTWEGIGANFMAISGRAPTPSVLHVLNVKGILSVELKPIDVEQVWRGWGDEIGVYALMRKVWEEHGSEYRAARVLTVGPAAARTRAGAICSAPVVKGELTHVDTWAGRGGLGSRLFQEHQIAAIVYGGDYEDEDLTDRKMVDGMFDERFGEPLKMVDLEKTTKYRFDPKFKTGGTFGSNYHTLRDRVLSFNYSSVLLDDAERLSIHERLIEPHYLRQFDEETAQAHQSRTCGEPCGAVCKKMRGKHKKDYEPYQAMGPLVGVFDQRAAEDLNRFADSCGFDAIQIGGEIAWVMECLHEGWLGVAETGIAEKPRWDFRTLEPVADSAHNARIAQGLIRWLLDDPRGAPLRQGIRHAARALGGPAAQAAVYNARGDGDCCLVPNQYWVAGMFAPMPILGRYYLDYGYEWKPPRELGRASAKRMACELMMDNYGMCRFHRGWAEGLLPEIIDRFQHEKVDHLEHHLQLARELNAFNETQPWETQRTRDVVHQYLRKIQRDGLKNPELDAWVARWDADPLAAANAYWHELRDGLEEGLRQPERQVA